MESHQKRAADFAPATRWIFGIISATGLLMIFLFQRVNWSSWILNSGDPAINAFLINRSVRFILNDIFAVLLIASIFGKRKYVLIAVYVQVAGFIFVLIPYIILKLRFPSYNGPLISFLHRLVLNPLLIYLLIFFFWHQEKHASFKSDGEDT